MKILFVTIALDAMPFIPLIYSELRKLPKEIDWDWFVVEGVARPANCTRWCAEQQPRLSKDGTTEYLEAVCQFDRRVNHIFSESWHQGKIAMVNAPLIVAGRKAGGDFLLWQIDSDEIHTAEQIVRTYLMFRDNPKKNAAFFWCNYFVGPDKMITTRNCFGNNSAFEWLRVWKVKPGMLFKTHEPPVIDGLKLNAFSHAETEARGLVFSHYSWCTRAQVEFKSKLYAGPLNPNARHYRGLVERWVKFQDEKTWPRPLREIFPWVEPFCSVNKV